MNLSHKNFLNLSSPSTWTSSNHFFRLWVVFKSAKNGVVFFIFWTGKSYVLINAELLCYFNWTSLFIFLSKELYSIFIRKNQTWKYKVNLSRNNFWTSPDRALELLSTNLLSFYFLYFYFSPEMHSLHYLNFSLFSLRTSVTFLCIRRITRNWRSDVMFCHF